ncbi:hypothetical protein U1Q18_036075 [Sarracenia purpurea var. burkii]
MFFRSSKGKRVITVDRIVLAITTLDGAARGFPARGSPTPASPFRIFDKFQRLKKELTLHLVLRLCGAAKESATEKKLKEEITSGELVCNDVGEEEGGFRRRLQVTGGTTDWDSRSNTWDLDLEEDPGNDSVWLCGNCLQRN